MRILGIETSCDETAAAVVEDGTLVLSNVIASSKAAFEALAGVIPEQAARRQVECIIPVVEEALEQAKMTWKDIDAIAVTKGPGLLGSLLVGTATARMLALAHRIPLIGVHHTLGHLSSTWLGATSAPQFPLITLSASGGHTDIWYRTSHTKGLLLGRTRDDAAGEAFDKGASMLGLPYPGGPSVSRAAEQGDEKKFMFPLPLHSEETFDFSFSGLKTTLKYLLRDNGWTLGHSSQVPIADIAASYELGICAHLLDRVKHAMDNYPDAKEVHIVGGVAANKRLRSLAEAIAHTSGKIVRVPTPLVYCTDNAAMIASAGYFLAQESPELSYLSFSTQASLPLEHTVLAA